MRKWTLCEQRALGISVNTVARQFGIHEAGREQRIGDN